MQGCTANNTGYGVTKKKKEEKKKKEALSQWQGVKMFVHINHKAI